MLSRRIGLVIEQPPDVDVLLPQRRLALFIEGARLHHSSFCGRASSFAEAP